MPNRHIAHRIQSVADPGIIDGTSHISKHSLTSEDSDQLCHAVPATVYPLFMPMNRRQFFQSGTAVALCADGMLSSSLKAEVTTAPLPNDAESAAVAAVNPPVGVRVAGIRMIPVVGGKYKVWTKRVGAGRIKVLL